MFEKRLKGDPSINDLQYFPPKKDRNGIPRCLKCGAEQNLMTCNSCFMREHLAEQKEKAEAEKQRVLKTPTYPPGDPKQTPCSIC
ncbi:hypothetical protein CAEBREN_15599 [Caenorhabditis brenneri]|uniref:Uncharacterized protein n=1 Tax=Caenorhabditis brenneri TaxID=135651 RepID=G0MYC5_CAEBE|nr:hypothetical protein CAEBREN_15599 [Caenorhabditis brenneri]